MTSEELIAQRQEVGAAYAAACAAYVEAFIELHAHDIALPRAVIGGGFPQFVHPTPHSEFLRDYLHSRLIERARDRAAELTVQLAQPV